MKRLTCTLFGFLALGGCTQDETLAAYGGADRDWVLHSIDGAEFAANATMQLGEAGAIGGSAPCNRWFSTQSAPYPWFALGPIGATKRACPDLEAERRFFDALGQMSLSEVSGNVLILSNDEGGEMVFRAE